VLNLVPSRLTAALTVAAAPVVDGERAETLRVWRRDGADHPSPNAGHCESAMAGALGVRLGGRNVYFGRMETRPFLGDGPRPAALDIRRAVRLSGTVGLAAVALAAGAATLAGRSARSGRVTRPRAFLMDRRRAAAGRGAARGGRA
jgi:adenosylcobinamide-phosphate synthase